KTGTFVLRKKDFVGFSEENLYSSKCTYQRLNSGSFILFREGPECLYENLFVGRMQSCNLAVAKINRFWRESLPATWDCEDPRDPSHPSNPKSGLPGTPASTR